jgi:demethylmenaquinone methyltransferase/2-methoxy-6-polyprenyl-1,4-benzoquinol methylase
MAAVKSGECALDVCCGTGDIAFGLARAGAQVIGADFSEPMLEVARHRSRNAQFPILNPQFVRGDAEALAFPENASTSSRSATVCAI